jgi:hypothetical protein
LLKEIEMQRKEKERLEKKIQDLTLKLKESSMNMTGLTDIMKKMRDPNNPQENLGTNPDDEGMKEPMNQVDKTKFDPQANLSMDPGHEIDFKEFCRRWEAANINDNIRAILLLKVIDLTYI